MTGTRISAVPWGRLFAAALIVACAFLAAPPAFAQGTPPGFDSIPRPPGSIGPSQNLMPPGSAGVLAPQTPSSPLQLAPPPAQPAALPTPGFDSIPRPPGSIGPSQNLMPPGSAGVLAPQ